MGTEAEGRPHHGWDDCLQALYFVVVPIEPRELSYLSRNANSARGSLFFRPRSYFFGYPNPTTIAGLRFSGMLMSLLRSCNLKGESVLVIRLMGGDPREAAR